MVDLIGIDGDIPWAISTLDTLINHKSKFFENFVTYVNNTVDNYFYNHFMPEMRRALSAYFYDSQIQIGLDELVQNRNQREKYAIDYLTKLASDLSLIYKLYGRLVVDINQRAIKARQSGQHDLSTFYDELKNLKGFTAKAVASWAQEEDDNFGTGIQDFLIKFMAIVVELQQRSIALSLKCISWNC